MYHHNHNPRPMTMEEEVIWLHSLWHAGSSANPNLGVNPNSLSIHKKNKKKKKKNAKTIEWPCEPSTDAPSPPPGEWGSWGSAAPPPPNASMAPSCKELALYRAFQVQQKGISASKQYFSTVESSEDEDEDSEDHELDASSKHVGFFLDLFEKDDELKNYFKQNYEKGEFFCFVCVAMGKKSQKTFKNCTSLVIHAHSILKMEVRGAHRSLAKVICQVIGWDVERLPTIVFACSKESKHSQVGAPDSTQRPDCSTESPCNLSLPDNPLLDAANHGNDGSNSLQAPVMCQALNDKEKMKMAALEVQRKAVSMSKEFFSIDNTSPDGAEKRYTEGEEESRRLGFFVDVFEKDSDLRNYYKQSFENGEFYCLVCMGLGEKKGKTFGNCTSLVQHANTILKTKGIEAHKAFSKVICGVLGWELKLPTIEHNASEDHEQSSSANTSNPKEEESGFCEACPCLDEDAHEVSL